MGIKKTKKSIFSLAVLLFFATLALGSNNPALKNALMGNNDPRLILVIGLAVGIFYSLNEEGEI